MNKTETPVDDKGTCIILCGCCKRLWTGCNEYEIYQCDNPRSAHYGHVIASSHPECRDRTMKK